MNPRSLPLAIVWLAALLIIVVLLRPHYEAQMDLGKGWEDTAELSQSAWVWSPPEVPYGLRFRPSHSRQVIYAAAIALLAGLALHTVSILPYLPRKKSAG